MIGATGDSDARSHAEREVADDDPGGQSAFDANRTLLGGGDAGSEDRELIASEPCEPADLLHRVQKTSAHHLEHNVARLMAERVVQLLEAVEVDDHQSRPG